jgi:hypothetical protein
VRFDPQRLRESLDGLADGAWTLPSSYALTGVHHGYRVSRRREEVARLFGWVLAGLEPVHQAWLAQLDPGGFIAPHRDAGPWLERWHVPIVSAGEWGDGYEPQPGVAFPVAHWEPHSVWNPTDAARIHIIIDRRIPIDRPPTPLELFPIPDRYAELVARAR